jgi:hypothetical protein
MPRCAYSVLPASVRSLARSRVAQNRSAFPRSLWILNPFIKRLPLRIVINRTTCQGLILANINRVKRVNLPVRSALRISADVVRVIARRMARVEKHLAGNPDWVLLKRYTPTAWKVILFQASGRKCGIISAVTE